jgi:hypothetical protein
VILTTFPPGSTGMESKPLQAACNGEEIRTEWHSSSSNYVETLIEKAVKKDAPCLEIELTSSWPKRV